MLNDRTSSDEQIKRRLSRIDSIQWKGRWALFPLHQQDTQNVKEAIRLLLEFSSQEHGN